MPSDSYQEDLIDRIEKDPEYGSLLLRTALEDALEDGYMDAFPLTLKTVIDATVNRGEALSKVDRLRQDLYQRLIHEEKPLSKKATLAALEKIGLDLELNSLETQLTAT